MAKKSAIKAAVVLSDLHAGGTTALCPADFETLEGQKIGLNIAQRFLLLKWAQFWEDIYARLNGDPFVLILNGDLIEGNHHRTKQLISPDVNDHVNAAHAILEPHVQNAAALLVSEGTDCHTGNTEHALAKWLKATPHPESRKYAWDRVDVTIHGCRCVFHHHMPATSREWLRPNALGAMLANEQLAAARNDEPRVKVLGMGHRHVPDSYSGAYGLAFVTPAWQITTRHTGKVVPHAGAARIETGGVLLDWRDKAAGDLPQFTPLTYRAQTSQGIAL